MRKQALRSLALGAVTLTGLALSGGAHAFPLQLTQAGIDLGFTLSTVVSGLNGNTASCCFVLGSVVNSAGQIIVNDNPAGGNLLFNNVDNQVGTAAALSISPNSGFPTAMANANGVVYAGGGNFRRLNNDGSTAQTYSGIIVNAGMWTNPVNQHIIATGSATSVGSGLIDIDVSGPTPSVRLINGSSSDGITVSPDGTIVFTNSAAFRISDGSLVATFSVSGADGMGVITSTNSLNGDVVVSTTGGNLVLLDADSNYSIQTLIASGGGYGDFATPDFTTGTLLLSSGDSLLRLGCGPACGVGAPPVDPEPPTSDVPAPGMTWLLGGALLALTRMRRQA